MQKLLALTGYAQVGKDLASTGLIGWTRVSFAQPIRDALVKLNPWVRIGLRLNEAIQLYGWDECKRNLPEVRRLMQTFGTEVGRDCFGSDVWVDKAEQKIIESGGPCVITDLRFVNEAEMVKRRRGLIVRVERPGIGPVNGHSSELQNIEADFTIVNDGTVPELHDKLREIANLIPDRDKRVVGA